MGVRRLKNPPIREAVLDIDCDLPTGQPLDGLEQFATQAFGDAYPKLERLWGGELELAMRPQEAIASARPGIQALRFRQDDGKQLVQVREHGFSFNRLAPYDSLDAYLPEIERTWSLYAKLAAPVEMQSVRLRYINRIPLPL